MKEEQKEQSKRKRGELAEAWRFVMNSNQGRLVIADILRMSGLYLSPFNGATNQTIKNVGMQDVGRLVESRARTHAFDSWLTMMREEFGND